MKIAIIGTGAMGTAFARHFAKAKHALFLCNREAKKGKELAKQLKADFVGSSAAAIQNASIILIAVKPKDFKELAKEIAPMLSKKHIVISVLAGTNLATLKKHLPRASIVRTMPNLAISCSEGVIGVVEEGISSDVKKTLLSLFKGIGLVYWLAENRMEAFTALCGSGPAFSYVFLEAMIQGAVSMGFSFKDAEKLVLQTFKGSLSLLEETKIHPAELISQIASPGGTTIAGLKEMEERGVRAGLWNTLLASYKRGVEMLEDFQK